MLCHVCKEWCTGIEGPLTCENGSVPGFKKSILRFEAFKLSGKSPGGFAIITDLGGNGETRWDIQSMELRQFQNQFVAELKGPFFGGPPGFVKNCIGNELKNSRLTLNVDSTCKAPRQSERSEIPEHTN